MDICKVCEDGHQFYVTYSFENRESLDNFLKMEKFSWDVPEKESQPKYEGFVERCDHGEVEDCEECID